MGVETVVIPYPPSLARLGDAGREKPNLGLLARILRSSRAVARYAGTLRLFLRQSGCTVVHSNGLKMHILGAWSASDARLVWHMHDYATRRPVMKRLLRVHARQCAAAVVNSNSVAADLRIACGRVMPIYTLHNAVDLSRFSPVCRPMDLDERCGLSTPSEGTVRVGLVATAAKWKGHEVFFRALAMLPKTMQVRGYVIGGPVYQTEGSQYGIGELKMMAAEAGVPGVGFTGHVDDVAAGLRSLDVVVHASTDPEPFGLVVAEGMACGRPVIASNSGGTAEIIALGPGVLGCQPGDPGRLAEHIRELVENRDLRIGLGEAARLTAEKYFDQRRLARQLVPIYTSVAA
jgi:glycosyltransferase involved in cell wall biosynthesis